MGMPFSLVLKLLSLLSLIVFSVAMPANSNHFDPLAVRDRASSSTFSRRDDGFNGNLEAAFTGQTTDGTGNGQSDFSAEDTTGSLIASQGDGCQTQTSNKKRQNGAAFCPAPQGQKGGSVTGEDGSVESPAQQSRPARGPLPKPRPIFIEEDQRTCPFRFLNVPACSPFEFAIATPPGSDYYQLQKCRPGT